MYTLMSLLDLPGEPSKLRVVDSTKSSITLGWERPIYDGGSEITHYVLDQMNTEEREWVTINPQVTTYEYVVSHLKPGTYYFFRVFAVNCKGKGEDIKMYQPVQAKDILGLYIKMPSSVDKKFEMYQLMISLISFYRHKCGVMSQRFCIFFNRGS